MPGPHLWPMSPADLMSYFTLPCHLPLSSLCRYNSILLWYFRGKISGRELTNWQSDLIENTINPTLAQAFNLTSSLTHCRPINPLLNPKAFLFCGQCATHCHKSPSASVSPRPHPPCVCVCVLEQGWVWVKAQLASSSCNLFCSGHICECTDAWTE